MTALLCFVFKLSALSKILFTQLNLMEFIDETLQIDVHVSYQGKVMRVIYTTFSYLV